MPAAKTQAPKPRIKKGRNRGCRKNGENDRDDTSGGQEKKKFSGKGG